MQHGSTVDPSLKPAKVSNRFNPRYIISSRRSNASSSADEGDLLFENRGATEEMEGVPQMTSPMKKMLMDNDKNDDESPAVNKTAVTAQSSSEKRTPGAMSTSGLYPAEVIEDDINSSLSAYGKGVSQHLKRMVDDQGDGASLSSYESYGFSLDGADYSTVANSTKYGY